MSPFKQKVIEIICMVPQGKVVSYGQVAAYAGVPRAAREVGWILNGSEGQHIDVPWWRVVNNKGYLSIRGSNVNDKSLQKKLLEAEGIIVSDEFELQMEAYRYQMSIEDLKKLQLSEEYIEKLTTKYGL
jgi:methylated-DNA-protein-cysteine methyltransferase related protein